jgi:Zn-finger nucleic acid-binding protein
LSKLVGGGALLSIALLLIVGFLRRDRGDRLRRAGLHVPRRAALTGEGRFRGRFLMREVAPRWPCPVRLGVTLQKTSVPAGGKLLLDHCPRCGGTWFEPGVVLRLRSQRQDDLWASVPRRNEESRAQ